MGANTQPSARSSLKGASNTSTMPSIRFISATSETSTITIDATFATRRRPSVVPRDTASITLSYFKVSARSPPATSPSSGTMIRATTTAPMTFTTEAIRTCPKALSITGPRTVAYKAMIDPATVDMPQVMTTKNSDRDRLLRYARITNGDSTMPRNTLDAAATPTAPPSPKVLRSAQAKPLITKGRTRQYQSTATNTLNNRIWGRTRNAKMTRDGPWSGAKTNGTSSPPRNPKMRLVSGLGGFFDRIDHVVQLGQRVAYRFHVQQQPGQRDLDGNPDDDLQRSNFAAAFAQ